jgi:uncharacterized protein YuzE
VAKVWRFTIAIRSTTAVVSSTPPNGTYLNEFRIKEAVDISYTKFHDAIDRNPFNQVQPAENQLYVGWTEPGEWFNLTVHVTEAGRYTLDILYTAAVDGEISIDVDQKPAVTALTIASTFAAAETIKWRNWHHWALAKNAATLELSRGDDVRVSTNEVRRISPAQNTNTPES